MVAYQLPKLVVAGSSPVSRSSSLEDETSNTGVSSSCYLKEYIYSMPLPIVAIVGRPNVGKSTLFNRVIKRQQAVVDPAPGVTRDRHYAVAEWTGIQFSLVDTGGYIPDGEGDRLNAAVREQTLIAAEEADVVILLTDAMTGESEEEAELARIILKRSAKALLVANKIDDPSKTALAYEGRRYGLGSPFPISAQTGFNVAEMLDEVVRIIVELKPVMPAAPQFEELSLAVIGAPNSGKSSMVNRLVGKERMVVSDIPGTTRDAVDTIVNYQGKAIRLVDTAGLRRKRYGEQGVEFFTSLRTLRALDRCDVAAVMIDSSLGLTQGDVRLVQTAVDAGVGVIIVMNKWDLLEGGENNAEKFSEDWKRRAPQLAWASMLFVSALSGRKSISIIEEALKIKKNRAYRISTSEINNEIIPLLQRTTPPAVKGKFVKVKYGAQVSVNPPKFAFFASYASLIPDQYYRFTERLIRERYGFHGVPIKIEFRSK